VVKRAEAEEEVTAGGEQSLASRRARACKNRVVIELGLAKPGSAGGLAAPPRWNGIPGGNSVCKNCARAKRAGVGCVRAHADKAGRVVLAVVLLLLL
jgi:hypothetical protein